MQRVVDHAGLVAYVAELERETAESQQFLAIARNRLATSIRSYGHTTMRNALRMAR